MSEDTFKPPEDAVDKDVARMKAYAKWLRNNVNEAARLDGEALARILDRLEYAER